MSGHLLLVSTGFEVLAIDTLGGASRDSARVLWRQDLIDNLAAMANVGLQQQVVDALGRRSGWLPPTPWAGPLAISVRSPRSWPVTSGSVT